MNLILLQEHDRLSGYRFGLGGKRAQHIREVLRSKPGDLLRVGLLNGPLGSAKVVTVGTSVELDCRFDEETLPRPLVDLILAVPRPKVLKRLLPQVTAMGVDRIVLLRTWRVAKPYLSSSGLGPEECVPLLHEGLMQGRLTHEPVVSVETMFRPFVEDQLPGFSEGGLRLVAHPPTETPLRSVNVAVDRRVCLVVGPEGGLLDFEVDLLGRAGFLPVSMGSRTLRVETACIALLAQLDLLRCQSAD